ncbi:hypothetical protein ACXYMU_02150 [Pontibacter sp. CAU 1760]
MRVLTLLLLAFCFGCQDKANPRFPDIKVAINDTSEIAISDSIYFITADTLPNKVTVVSEVSDANMFYAVNNAASTMSTNESITLQRQDTVFQFYLTKRGYDNSNLKTVLIQAHSKKYLAGVKVSTPVSDANLNISMNDKTRGIMEVEIFSITGQKLLQRNHLKNAD